MEDYLLTRQKRIEDARNLAIQFFKERSAEQIMLETGTAIGGVIGASGKAVILGADSQMTAGHRKIMGFEKIFEIDKYTAVGITGAVAFLQDIVKIFEVEICFRQMLKSDGTVLSPGGKANILAGLVKQVISLPLVYGIGMGFLLAVYDPKDDEARLFTIGSLGSVYEDKKKFSADGCGGIWVYSIFRSNYDEFGGVNMNKKNLVKLTRKAIQHAIDNDSYCGGKKLIYLVDEKGARRMK